MTQTITPYLCVQDASAALDWYRQYFRATVGNVIVQRGGDPAFAGQLLTAVGSLAGFLGFMMLVRGRIPGGDRPALLDAAILASGLGVLIWAFGLAPYVIAARQSSVVSAAPMTLLWLR